MTSITNPTSSHSTMNQWLLALTIAMAVSLALVMIFVVRLSDRQSAAETNAAQQISAQQKVILALSETMKSYETRLTDDEKQTKDIKASFKEIQVAQKSQQELLAELSRSQESWQKEYVMTLLKLEHKLDGMIEGQQTLQDKILNLEETVAANSSEGIKTELQSLKTTLDRVVESLPYSEQKNAMMRELHPDLFQ